MKFFLTAAALVLMGTGSLGLQSTPRSEPIVLTFGLYQYDKPTELYRTFTPVIEALQQGVEERLGRSTSIELVISKTYDDAIDALCEGKIDFVRFGPASYVISKSREPKIELLAIEEKKGGRLFPGVIVVQTKSPFKQLSDVAGHSFAFGDENSTIGRYLVQSELLAAGVSQKDLKGFGYLGRHDKVAKAVELGDFDAGSLKKGTFDKMNKKGQMRVLHEFQNITKPWIARAGMDAEVAAALREVLIEMNDEEALKKLKVSGFGEVRNAEFGFIRRSIEQVRKGF
jgi:phosphonate transport system substrate-binding protein